jgi:hypothetical protein
MLSVETWIAARLQNKFFTVASTNTFAENLVPVPVCKRKGLKGKPVKIRRYPRSCKLR